MRLRFLLLVLVTALVVAFALLNWEAFSRPVPLDLGWGQADAPLPLVLLGVLALAVVGFLVAGAAREAHHRRLERDQARALQSQRELAERAEASRFTDLRQVLEGHLRESRQHDATAAAAGEQALARTQREVRTQSEQLHRALSARLGEMEARLDARLARLEGLPSAAARLPEAVHDTRHEPLLDPSHERIAEADARPAPVRPR